MPTLWYSICTTENRLVSAQSTDRQFHENAAAEHRRTNISHTVEVREAGTMSEDGVWYSICTTENRLVSAQSPGRDFHERAAAEHRRTNITHTVEVRKVE